MSKWIKYSDQHEWQGEDVATWKNPSPEILLANGYGLAGDEPAIEAGYTRISKTFAENGWQVVDRLTSEIEQEQAAATAAEAASQLAKPEALKIVENQFLTVCESLTGSKAKLGFDELEVLIKTLAETDKATADTLTAALFKINSAGVYHGGTRWWDSCAYHAEVTP